MKPESSRPRQRHALVAIALLASGASALSWADGQLDTTFGQGGVVRINFPNAPLGRFYDAAIVRGAIEAAGFATVSDSTACTPLYPKLLVVRLSLSGQIMSAPKSYAQSAIRCPLALAVDAKSGDIFVSGMGSSVGGPTGPTVIRFSTSGSVIASYSVSFAFNSQLTDRRWCWGRRMLVDDASRVVLKCGIRHQNFVTVISLLRFSTQGNRLIPTPAWGLPIVGHPPGLGMTGTIARDAASGAYYEGGRLDGGYSPYVTRHSATSLSLDTNYANQGVAKPWPLAVGDVYGLNVDDSGDVVLGGPVLNGATLNGYVARLTAAGTADPTFGSGGLVKNIATPIVDLLTDFNNRIYALTELRLWRLKIDGTLDGGFLPRTGVVTLNGPGSKWHGMHLVDSNRSSAYLFGGAGASNAATKAIIARVLLN